MLAVQRKNNMIARDEIMPQPPNRRGVLFLGVDPDKVGRHLRPIRRKGSVINESTFQWSVIDGFAGAKKNVFHPNKENGNEEHGTTLISKQCYYTLPILFLFYLILQFGIISHQPYICRGENGFSTWVGYVKVAVAACFLLTASNHFCVAFFMGSWERRDLEHPRSVYLAAATVSLVAGISTLVTITNGDHSVCVDALGVETYQAQWAEWLTTVPLLSYVTIAIEDKSQLTSRDLIIIMSMFCTIFFGFVMNFIPKDITLHLSKSTTNEIFGFSMFSISCFFMTGVYFIIGKQETGVAGGVKPVSAAASAMAEQASVTVSSWKSERTVMKNRLSRLLFSVMPLFPLVYALRLTNVLNRDQLVVGNLFVGMIAKLIFVSILSLESILVQLSLESKANESRRQFLRYVFHEVRVPLNTMTMGISVLRDTASGGSTVDDTGASCGDPVLLSPAGGQNDEILDMMSNAANFMNETLNDVLSISNIEDGTMNLVLQPFKVHSIVNNAISVVKGRAASKRTRIIVEGVKNPRSLVRTSTLVGDRFRLEQVLVNLLSQAMLASPDSADVVIKVSAKEVWSDAGEDSEKALPGVHPTQGAAGQGHGNNNSSSNPIAMNRGSSEMLRKGLSIFPNILSKRSAMKLMHKSTRLVARGKSSVLVSLAMLSSKVVPQNRNTAQRRREPVVAESKRGTKKIEITIKIYDSGVGITAERQRQMFVPFAEIRPHELQDGAGSGLGLVLAKEIVAMHGGKIFSESGVDRGNMCGFTIPFDVVEDDSMLSPSMMRGSFSSSGENGSMLFSGLGGGYAPGSAASAAADSSFFVVGEGAGGHMSSSRLNRVAVSVKDTRRSGGGDRGSPESVVVGGGGNVISDIIREATDYYQNIAGGIDTSSLLKGGVSSSHHSSTSSAAPHSRGNSVKRFASSLSNYFGGGTTNNGQPRKVSETDDGGRASNKEQGGGGGGGGIFFGGDASVDDNGAAARSQQSINDRRRRLSYGDGEKFVQERSVESPPLNLNFLPYGNSASTNASGAPASVTPVRQLLLAGAEQLNLPSTRRLSVKRTSFDGRTNTQGQDPGKGPGQGPGKGPGQGQGQVPEPTNPEPSLDFYSVAPLQLRGSEIPSTVIRNFVPFADDICTPGDSGTGSGCATASVSAGATGGATTGGAGTVAVITPSQELVNPMRRFLSQRGSTRISMQQSTTTAGTGTGTGVFAPCEAIPERSCDERSLESATSSTGNIFALAAESDLAPPHTCSSTVSFDTGAKKMTEKKDRSPRGTSLLMEGAVTVPATASTDITTTDTPVTVMSGATNVPAAATTVVPTAAGPDGNHTNEESWSIMSGDHSRDHHRCLDKDTSPPLAPPAEREAVQSVGGESLLVVPVTLTSSSTSHHNHHHSIQQQQELLTVSGQQGEEGHGNTSDNLGTDCQDPSNGNDRHTRVPLSSSSTDTVFASVFKAPAAATTTAAAATDDIGSSNQEGADIAVEIEGRDRQTKDVTQNGMEQSKDPHQQQQKKKVVVGEASNVSASSAKKEKKPTVPSPMFLTPLQVPVDHSDRVAVGGGGGGDSNSVSGTPTNLVTKATAGAGAEEGQESKDEEDRLGSLEGYSCDSRGGRGGVLASPNTSISSSNKGTSASAVGAMSMTDLEVSVAAAVAVATASASHMQHHQEHSGASNSGRSVAGSTAGTPAGSMNEKMKFLLVDDTMSNNKMLKMLLAKRGITSDQAFNGQEGIDKVQTNSVHAYNLIFMDYTMPIKNGAEATAGIRALGFTGLIIGLTGNALDDDVQRFLKAGVDCVIPKPFRDEQLAKILGIIASHGATSTEDTRLALLRKLASTSSAVSGAASGQSFSGRSATSQDGQSLRFQPADRRPMGDATPKSGTPKGIVAALSTGERPSIPNSPAGSPGSQRKFFGM